MGTYIKNLYRLGGGILLASLLMLTISTGNISAQSLHTTYADLPCVNKAFNVMVYISVDEDGNTGISPENIQEAFAEANRIFEPICMSFKIAKIETIINYSYNELDSLQRANEAVNLFSLKNRLNVYFVADVNTFPGTGHSVGNIFSEGLAGLFVVKYYPLSLVHQLGIFFGLTPTHEDPGAELVNGTNCEEEGDQICDTPADPFLLNGIGDLGNYINVECEFIFSVTDPNGDYYQPDVGNAMSYYGCPCTGFTRGQFLKMVENYNNAAVNLW